MEVKNIDFGLVLKEKDDYDCLLKNYEALGTDWVVHQWTWLNGVYISFEDHVKSVSYTHLTLPTSPKV